MYVASKYSFIHSKKVMRFESPGGWLSRVEAQNVTYWISDILLHSGSHLWAVILQSTAHIQDVMSSIFLPHELFVCSKGNEINFNNSKASGLKVSKVRKGECYMSSA